MSGPGRPAYTDTIEILEISQDLKEVTFKSGADLLEYLKQNGNSYVASFTPAGPAEGSGSTEAPAS